MSVTPFREKLSALATSLASLLRLRRFFLVGLVGLATDMALIAVLVEGFAMAPVAAKFLSAEAAIVVMFALNERWTFESFQDDGWGGLARRLLTSNLVRVLGVLVAAGVLYGLNAHLGVFYLFANLAGIGAAFLTNYAMESLFTWRVHRD